MINFEVQVRKEDVDRMVGIFASFPELINEFGDLVTSELLLLVQERTPVKSGRLRDSWVKSAIGNMYSITTGIPYAPILEEGLYKELGPGTIAIGERIYSRKAIGGIVGPILRGDADKGMNLRDAVHYALERLMEEVKTNVSA